ncbi:MAG TPA: hypothetical protein VGY56_16870 [Verrucomicrobiae bacterium]|nr:hypothetical protein [Verrucomicrobiae bacterium]
MKTLPETDQTLLIRRDFSNDTVWQEIRSAASQPGPGFQEALGLMSEVREAAGEPLDEIETNLHIVDDRDYAGATVEQLLEGWDESAHQAILIVVDGATISDPDHPVLIVDLGEERGRAFRALPSCVFEIESNLSICNVDWEDFANAVDDDGVYRGFGET